MCPYGRVELRRGNRGRRRWGRGGLARPHGLGLDAVIDSVASAVLVWRFRSEQEDAVRADHIERRAVHTPLYPSL